MAERIEKHITLTNSGKIYEGIRTKFFKEKLLAMIDEVKNGDTALVLRKLSQHKTTNPDEASRKSSEGSKESEKSLEGKNYFEFIALYQKVLKESGYEVDIDGHFGPKTFKALLKFQKEKLGIRKADGIPGPRTTAAIISYLAKGGPNTKEEVNMRDENEEVQEILKNARKISDLKYNSFTQGSYYAGSSNGVVDYAVIKQMDGEYFVYDKPIDGKNERRVYRTDSNLNVLVVATIESTGALKEVKKVGDNIMNRVPYDPPIPKPVTQTDSNQ